MPNGKVSAGCAGSSWHSSCMACARRPDFVAYRVNDLPAVAPRAARFFGLPLLTWTVRSDADRARARASPTR